MEPRQSSHEQAPITAPQSEQLASNEFALPGAERRPEGAGHEQLDTRPSTAEANRQVAQAMPSTLPAPVPAPVATDDSAQQDDDIPVVAADEDLIEKEWVDKAKQVIASTKDDPYRREQEIKRLQLEYVRKRYGKNIGAQEG